MKKQLLIILLLLFAIKVNSFAAASLAYESLNWTQSSGNGDAVINRGESIYLKPVIHNSGASGTDGVYGWLTTSSPYVTFTYTQGYPSYAMSYGTIGAGASGTTSSSYGLVKFAANTPPGTVITFTLNIRDTYGNTWSSNFTVTVAATDASLAYDSLNWTQSSGNGDAVINRGESIYLKPVIHNSGASGTDGVYGWLTTSSPYVTFTYTQGYPSYAMSYGTIGAGASGTTSSSYGLVKFAANTPPGSRFVFTLNIKDSYSNVWISSFTIAEGGANQVPVLSWTGETNYTASGVSPEIGDKNTSFIFRTKYSDPDGDDPASGYPKLHILKGGSEMSGSPFAMTYVSGANSTGAIYSYSKTLVNGTDYSYYFEARDIFGGVAANFPPAVKAGPGVYKSLINWTGEAGYTADGVSPESGDRNAGYIYRLKFSDSDNAVPAAGFPKLHIKQGGAEISGSPFTMTYVSGAYTTGAIYSYTKTLMPGTNYAYYFEAQDADSAAAGGSPTPENDAPDVSNQLPSLAWTGETNYLNDGVFPKAASSAEPSVFRVKYSDADNDAPAAGYPRLYVKKGAAQVSGSPFLMNCSGTGYVAGVICDFSKVLGSGDYSYRFEAFDLYNGLASGAPAGESGGLVSIGTDLPAPQEVKVYHGVFKPGENEKTNVSFNTAAPVSISVTVYNNVGRKVKELYRGGSSAGLNLIQWDGRDDGGQRVSSGVYTIKIEGGGINQSKRVVVVR